MPTNTAPTSPAPDTTGPGHPDDELVRDIAAALNRISREQISNTPDRLLADMLVGVLALAERLVNERDAWYDRAPRWPMGGQRELVGSLVNSAQDLGGGRLDPDMLATALSHACLGLVRLQTPTPTGASNVVEGFRELREAVGGAYDGVDSVETAGRLRRGEYPYKAERAQDASQENLAGLLLNAVGDVVLAPGRGYSPAGFASVMQRAGLALVRIEGGPREPKEPPATIAFRNFDPPDRPEPPDDHLQRELDAIVEHLQCLRRQAAGTCHGGTGYARAFGQLEVAVDTAASRIRVLIHGKGPA